MKSIIIVLAFCLVCAYAGQFNITPELLVVLKEARTTCVRELELSGADIASIIDSMKKGEENHKADCVNGCLLQKLDLLKPDGTIDKDVLRSTLVTDVPKEKIEEVVNRCSQVGKDTCETGKKVFYCLRDNLPKSS